MSNNKNISHQQQQSSGIPQYTHSQTTASQMSMSPPNTVGMTKRSSHSRDKRKKSTKNFSRPQKKKDDKKPVVRRPPVFTYTSACCGTPARKPFAGKKVESKDPESGKIMFTAKGLGHWRCSQCGKGCKVKREVAKKQEDTNVVTENAG